MTIAEQVLADRASISEQDVLARIMAKHAEPRAAEPRRAPSGQAEERCMCDHCGRNPATGEAPHPNPDVRGLFPLCSTCREQWMRDAITFVAPPQSHRYGGQGLPRVERRIGPYASH